MARKQARRRKQAPQRRINLPRIPLARIGGVLLACGVVFASYRLSAMLLDRPITAITIDGPFERVSALQIEEAISTELAKGFLTADLDTIRDRLAALQWIDRANVVRRWPGQLEISVNEQVPAACWGEQGLLNTRGDLFVTDARHVPAELPRLSGPEGHSAEVAGRYLRIREQLIPRGLDVRRLHLDARGAWDMTLQNGIHIRIGKRDVAARTELFLDVVADIITRRATEIEYVDLRYSNGFTIGWNGATPTPKDESIGERQMLAERNE
ncbi:MAG: FtsQ-type POTRA domain-containing protein [Woeseia sp.]|nr:cell division protein FtsQ/DivIB [Woeseia sp.]MBT8096759.1 cell division protein FtsQ/DivIB [Woeseia sp.]NNE59795.1 FtsQ-type POTRA domain-containing protein [Woeseia sp.]NNL54833.1 FtsQ-type POTRA domain-containing protein [Woeseia sp.]